MWHEARRQEKKIRCMMVDYRKRADRRREFYEKIKLDPTVFLRVFGRATKIHLDPAVALAAEGPQIMQPWQGNNDILIDRYDVRAHIDFIPPAPTTFTVPEQSELEEESKCNYERYRILVQNECAGVAEEQCLHQIFIDEQFGAIDTASKKAEEDKKRVADKKAAIAYTYEDSTPAPKEEAEDEEEESSDEEIDLDNILDIDKLTVEQEQLLSKLAFDYGMQGFDYSDCLQVDREEADALRQARQLEEEKAQFAGRKSRRERRAFKEKRLQIRPNSPPSYATRQIPKGHKNKESSSSRSRSRSPPVAGVVQFITSYGGHGGLGTVALIVGLQRIAIPVASLGCRGKHVAPQGHDLQDGIHLVRSQREGRGHGHEEMQHGRETLGDGRVRGVQGHEIKVEGIHATEKDGIPEIGALRGLGQGTAVKGAVIMVVATVAMTTGTTV